MLSSAVDDADPDADMVVAVLDGIDGAWSRGELGSQQADAGDRVALDDL